MLSFWPSRSPPPPPNPLLMQWRGNSPLFSTPVTDCMAPPRLCPKMNECSALLTLLKLSAR
jgi:hypothetical protein